MDDVDKMGIEVRKSLMMIKSLTECLSDILKNIEDGIEDIRRNQTHSDEDEDEKLFLGWNAIDDGSLEDYAKWRIDQRLKKDPLSSCLSNVFRLYVLVRRGSEVFGVISVIAPQVNNRFITIGDLYSCVSHEMRLSNSWTNPPTHWAPIPEVGGDDSE